LVGVLIRRLLPEDTTELNTHLLDQSAPPSMTAISSL
jgi:hypothetical protein